jgi:hypothetical protein
VGDGGSDLTEPDRREIGKQGGGEAATEVGKRVAVEEEKRRPPMAMPKEIERLLEGVYGRLPAPPFRRDRFVSFRIRSVLRATSFARCSVEADDKLPVPVLEKRGSGA